MDEEGTRQAAHGPVDDATQPATQQVLDPRRLGRNNSGLNDSDVSDVLCILHPSSPAAFRIVAGTAERFPQHVLQNNRLVSFQEDFDLDELEEQETFISPGVGNNAQDLALRLSSRTRSPLLGFCFGRNPHSCDIVIDVDSVKRVSNLHFRIYVNHAGVLMLEDMSTNGTLVDEKHLKGKNARVPATRMLTSGSIIHIPSPKPDEAIKFIVRIPSRSGHMDEHQEKMERYQMRLAELEKAQIGYDAHLRHQQQGQLTRRMPPRNPHGMHWDGGEDFNVVDLLGKGAFATVYRLATKLDGQYYAAKELEKKRFIKNGRLDQRLDNEMQIMKSIKHPNIVEYIGYQDHFDYLYIIMEFVPCGDLQQYLAAHTTLPEPEAQLMSRQIFDALHYLHCKQITHRDIKPDNILIAVNDPFTIKLSDFGLSKVVPPDETFLKTFCGTLLYCAPEVFPHYEEHVAKKGQKRRRSGPNPPANFHSYSQSVDIWSYAAVLWLSLCNSPPFEGIVDQTGKGMFTKIMGTRLDTTPLLSRGISSDAIDLLTRMLNTDPAQRPSEIDCLNHPWLFDGTIRVSGNVQKGLRVISEEDDEEEEDNERQAEIFSQLSIADAHAIASAEQLDLSSGEFLGPRVSKRVKPDVLVPNNQIRNQAAIASSSPAISFSDYDFHPEEPVPSTARQPRLFGEIGASALQSSGALGACTTTALAMDTNRHDSPAASISDDYDMHIDEGTESFQERQITSDLFRSDGNAFAAASLLGAEALVEDLNMESPNSAVSPDAPSEEQSFEPQTPRTPEPSPLKAISKEKPPSQNPSSQEVTPKPRKPFDRQIKMTIPAALLYDPIGAAKASTNPSMPPTQYGSLASAKSGIINGATTAIADISADSGNPPPRFGRLKSTTDSFKHLTLDINSRIFFWGRDFSNTNVYEDRFDTRIPKKGIAIFFHALGIEKTEEKGRDWGSLPNLHTLIKTYSRRGILVNGVQLKETDHDGVDLCGRVYTGDIVTVFEDMRDGSGQSGSLRFVCEFYAGEAANRRPASEVFSVIRAEEPPSTA
jgi:serine/threonine protein kinase